MGKVPILALPLTLVIICFFYKSHPNRYEMVAHYVMICFSLMIQKMKIMASGPITSWEIDGETVVTVSDFIWGGSKITAGGDCSHEIKRYLLLGKKL